MRRVGHSLGPDRHRRPRVAALWPLLQPVALHQQIATIGDVHQIAGIPVRPIGDIIVDQYRAECARFDMVADVLVDESRVFDVQLADRSDIDAVSTLRIAFAVAAELAVDDPDRAAAGVAGQNTVFVVKEPAVYHRQVMSLDADTRAIVVRYRHMRESQVANCRVVALNNENPLAGTGFIGEHRTRSSAFDGQAVGAPGGAIGVLAGRDPDDITRLCDGRRLTRQRQPLTGSDLEHAARFGRRRTGRQQRDEYARRDARPPPHVSITHAITAPDIILGAFTPELSNRHKCQPAQVVVQRLMRRDE